MQGIQRHTPNRLGIAIPIESRKSYGSDASSDSELGHGSASSANSATWLRKPEGKPEATTEKESSKSKGEKPKGVEKGDNIPEWARALQRALRAGFRPAAEDPAAGSAASARSHLDALRQRAQDLEEKASRARERSEGHQKRAAETQTARSHDKWQFAADIAHNKYTKLKAEAKAANKALGDAVRAAAPSATAAPRPAPSAVAGGCSTKIGGT
eukprot:jgi/Mesvir1/492/Mv11363-RA.1